MTDVRPIITSAGQEHTGTGQSGGCVRVSGVGPQHTPAKKICSAGSATSRAIARCPTTTATRRPEAMSCAANTGSITGPTIRSM